jgi:hypothetical protein
MIFLLLLRILEAQWGYHRKKKIALAYTMKFWEDVELEVFGMGIKE